MYFLGTHLISAALALNLMIESCQEMKLILRKHELNIISVT